MGFFGDLLYGIADNISENLDEEYDNIHTFKDAFLYELDKEMERQNKEDDDDY